MKGPITLLVDNLNWTNIIDRIQKPFFLIYGKTHTLNKGKDDFSGKNQSRFGRLALFVFSSLSLGANLYTKMGLPELDLDFVLGGGEPLFLLQKMGLRPPRTQALS
jgi:hypothetical protein